MIREYDELTLKKIQKIEMMILKDFMDLCDEHKLRYFGLAGTGIGAIRHQGFIPWDDDIDIALPRKDFDQFITLAKEKLSDKYYILNTEENPNYPLMTTRLCLKGTKFREDALKMVDCPFGIFLDLYVFDNLADDEKFFKKQAWSAWFWSKILILRSIPHPVLAFKGVKGSIIQFICACVHYILSGLHISKKWIYHQGLKACTKYSTDDTSRIGFLCDTNPFSNMFSTKNLYPLQKLPFEDVELTFPKDLDGHLTYLFGNYMQFPPVEQRKNHYPYELDFGEYDEKI